MIVRYYDSSYGSIYLNQTINGVVYGLKLSDSTKFLAYESKDSTIKIINITNPKVVLVSRVARNYKKMFFVNDEVFLIMY